MEHQDYRREVVVRRLEPDEFDAGALVLASSFAEEAIFASLLGSDAEDRSRLLVDFMRGMLKGHAPFSEIDGAFVGHRLAGLAISIRPDRFPLQARDMLRIAMRVLPASIPLIVTRPGILRLFRAASVLEKHHPRDEACWYLAFFGVDPANRKGGVARRLAEAVLSRADDQNVGCYLDTAGQKTMRMCRFLGFEVRHMTTPFPDGPTCWGMWRSPRPGG